MKSFGTRDFLFLKWNYDSMSPVIPVFPSFEIVEIDICSVFFTGFNLFRSPRSLIVDIRLRVLGTLRSTIHSLFIDI